MCRSGSLSASKPVSVRDHQAFIEALVERNPSIGADLIRREGLYSRARTDAPLNALVESLDDEQRELLARIVQQERTSAIFAALVELHERCALDDWTLQRNGTRIPHEPFGYTMFEEFITLLDDERGWDALT